MKAQTDTRSRILDVAQDLVQRRGVNAMSFQDLADAVGIRKPSIHHYFPDKNAMVVALLERYQEQFDARVQPILEAKVSGAEQLSRYIELFVETLHENPQDKACLCGMLAAEVATLGSEGVTLIQGFFESNVKFLSQILLRGRTDGSLQVPGELTDTAAMVLSTLEGSLLVARCEGGVGRMQLMLKSLLRLLGAV